MTQINREWAISKLRGYIEAASITYVPDGPNTMGFWTYKLDKPKAEVQAATQIIEQVLDRTLPGWRTAEWTEPKRQPLWREREAAHRAIAQLEADQELADNLGSDAPQLDASTLHPWVWGSVQGLWGRRPRRRHQRHGQGTTLHPGRPRIPRRTEHPRIQTSRPHTTSRTQGPLGPR